MKKYFINLHTGELFQAYTKRGAIKYFKYEAERLDYYFSPKHIKLFIKLG